VGVYLRGNGVSKLISQVLGTYTKDATKKLGLMHMLKFAGNGQTTLRTAQVFRLSTPTPKSLSSPYCNVS
jgi:hypothetical protein